MKLSKLAKVMLNDLNEWYIQHNSSEIDIDVINVKFLSLLKFPHRDLHHVSIIIRELKSNKLVEANFKPNNDECTYMKLTDKGQTYFEDKRFEILKSVKIPIITSVLTSILTTLLTLLIKS